MSQRLKPCLLTGRPVDPEIKWADYDRIIPGMYFARSIWAKHYWDPGHRRWTCLVRFDVYSADYLRVVARVPLWLNLGNLSKPRAGRRGNYFKEWVRANGGPPSRNDRLSPRVFIGRIARLKIGDTIGEVPYSVVKGIVSWETGAPRRVTQSASHTVKEGMD